MRNTDLHTHSYYSDGRLSPKELVRLAKKRKIKNLALTDHDSVDGVREAIEEGKKIGIRIIPALELSCEHSEILGYFIDINNKDLLKDLRKFRKKTEEKVRDDCKRIRNAGYDLSFSEIQKRFPESRNNINGFYPLFVLYKKGYGKPFEVAMELKEKVLGGKKIKKLTVMQAIKLVKKAGGVPVLAHPWLDDETLKEKNFKKYVMAGLKGIEISNGDNAVLRKRKHVARMKKLIRKYNLIVTKGTDYHGKELTKLMPGKHDLGQNSCDSSVVLKLEKAIV